MSELQPIAAGTGRPTYVLVLDALDGWPQVLPFEGTPFSVLLITDGRDVADDGFRAWNAFARRAADQGMAYFSTWGPDCERLHDVMDESVVQWEVIEKRPARYFIMTTWHEDEDLAEALWFVRHVAFNPECQQGDEPCVLALVGRPDLLERIEALLSATSA